MNQKKIELEFRANHLASGQKIIIYSLIANFLINVATKSAPELGTTVFMLAGFFSTAAMVYGAYRVCTGLEYSIVIKVITMILMLVPLINLIGIIILSLKATKILRSAGYVVGLFGVK